MKALILIGLIGLFGCSNANMAAMGAWGKRHGAGCMESYRKMGERRNSARDTPAKTDA